MSGPDMILGFIISYADGKLQEYMKPDLESLLEKCYDRALKKWSKNEGIRRDMELGYHRHVQQLTETILHSQKEMNAEDKQLVALWVNEIQKDLNPIGDFTFLPFSSERKIYAQKVWDVLSDYIS